MLPKNASSYHDCKNVLIHFHISNQRARDSHIIANTIRFRAFCAQINEIEIKSPQKIDLGARYSASSDIFKF